jgi:hypothetical protein
MEEAKSVNKEVLTSALILASKMWGNGKLNVPKPQNEELKVCQNYLYGLEKADMNDGDVQNALSMLILNNIGRHFDIVARHRYWVKCSYELAKSSNFLKCADELEERINIHDIEKYGPDEALGYSIMFGMDGKFRKLDGEDKQIWECSLEHHLKNHSHHPEYHNDSPMPVIDLEESLIDMLGCRLERDLKPYYYSLNPGKILDIPYLYLKRYRVLDDKIRIKSYIYDWKEGLEVILTDNGEHVLKEWEQKTDLRLFKSICAIKT